MTKSATRSFADELGIDDNATSTAVTIDASENVLVGQTSLNTANNGHSFGANGNYAHHTSTESTTLILNRKTSDGDIVRLRKDNAAVGSIGAKGGELTIGSGDVGIRFKASLDTIWPVDTATQNSRDAAVDIGYSTVRWKDLYLSGGVYLGGTGAANKLDDYEEGTWTPVVVGGITINNGTPTWIGAYTKIGNKVFYTLSASGTFNATFSANAEFSGLPFSVATIDTGLIHDASGGERSITETYSNEHIYILDALGSSIASMLRGSGSYTTT